MRLLSPPRADDTRKTMPRMPRIGGIVTAIVAVIVLIVVLSAVHLLPQLRNPFAETTTVRSQPVILKSITNLSRYEAASGSFQVVVDLTKRSSLIPSSSRAARRCSSGRAPTSPTSTSPPSRTRPSRSARTAPRSR